MSPPRTYKTRIKGAVSSSGLLRLAARFAPLGTAILRYHSVQYEPERYANSIGAGIIHPYSSFQEQMEIIAGRFKPVSLGDVCNFLENGRALPHRSVAVTFDDGFADNHEIAAPVLHRLGIPASFYVIVDTIGTTQTPWYCRLRHAFGTTSAKEWIDSEANCVQPMSDAEERKSAFLLASRRCARLSGEKQEKALRRIEHELEVEALRARECPMMSWDQIRELHRAGHVIGSHTLTHPNLAHVTEQELQRELIESKQKLDEELGMPTVHFSYPSPILEPHHTVQTMAVTREAGYQSAVTCAPGLVRAGDSPLSLRRVFAPIDRDEFLWRLDWAFLGNVA